MNFPHLAQRLFNVPLAIRPEKAEIIMAALAERLGISHLTRDGRPVPIAFDFDLDDPPAPAADRGYDPVAGVAIIPVHGTLVQRIGSMRPYSGMSGYDQIRAALAMALDDEDIEGIVLDIDSPGGEVAGCFDLVDAIYGCRGQKPIWAILGENAYSAAYAIASAADRITVPRTGGTGSIGILCLHVDFSKALSAAGVNVTMITYGDRKAEGNEFEPLADPVLARMQADVDRMGALFCATVARNRGLADSAVKGTQAGTFLGVLGVEAGLADAVMAPDEAFHAFCAELG